MRYVTERRNRNGTVRRYWQVSGQRPVRLPEPGWQEVAARLNADRDARRVARQQPSGTVAWVIGQYRETDRFTRLAPNTLRGYQRWLDVIETIWGTLEIADITRQVCIHWIDLYKSQPASQKLAAAVLYNVLAEAQYHGLVGAANPAGRLRLSASNRRAEVWSPEDRAAWTDTARAHRHAKALAIYFALLEYTAQRPVDVLAMRWENYDGKRIELVQQKTGKLVRVPVHHELRAIMNEDVRHIAGPIVGLGLTLARKLFAEVSAVAGIEGLQARDLRRTACVRLAEAGCTAIEIAAISGHSIERTTQILETYVPRTEAMGAAAMARWERNEPTR